MQLETKSEIFAVVIIGTILLLLLSAFLISFLFIYQKRQHKHIQETQALQARFNHEILQAQLEIQEQTFKNISQEVHDNIGQVLSLAKLNVTTMDVNDTGSLKEKIGNSKQLLTKAIQDLRDLSKSLNTDYVKEMGLLKSVEYELDLLRKSAAVETSLDVNGRYFRLKPQEELIIFRIVQEIINNIIKHAEAKTIAVAIHYDPVLFKLDIVDDGKGFDASTVGSKDISGIGIKNMHNRTNMIGATFDLQTTPGNGTSVTLTLPISDSKT